MVVGNFTVSDVNNAGTNGGCSGIKLFDSNTYWANLTGASAAAGWTVHPGGGSSAVGAAGESNWLFQAYDLNTASPGTASFITGDVGDSNPATSSPGPPASNQTPEIFNGHIPCIDIGGVGGG